MTFQLVKIDSSPDLVDRVYTSLVDAISTGALPGGTRVTQEDLAERLHVSRQPVLQALRLLKSEGLLCEASGRGGLQVAPLDAALLLQVYQVRSAVDALAARLAAQSRFIVPARLIERGRKAVRQRDLSAAIDADMAFHGALYAGSGNPLIAHTARLHWCHVRRAMGTTLRSASRQQDAWDEHEAIAHAVAAGRADEAERLVHRHAQSACIELTQALADAAQPAPPRTRPRGRVGA